MRQDAQYMHIHFTITLGMKGVTVKNNPKKGLQREATMIDAFIEAMMICFDTLPKEKIDGTFLSV